VGLEREKKRSVPQIMGQNEKRNSGTTPSLWWEGQAARRWASPRSRKDRARLRGRACVEKKSNVGQTVAGKTRAQGGAMEKGDGERKGIYRGAYGASTRGVYWWYKKQ